MSEKTKHTPGPWEFGRIRDVKFPEWYIGSSAADVAQISILMDASRTDQEHIANARLIAAAPDLLEALECLLADTCQEGYYSQADSDSVINAKAAIAKVKGGQDG
ncbi:MAG: hypothetical protein AAFX93_15840 [Verrucomicrobiota bacterium]